MLGKLNHSGFQIRAQFCSEIVRLTAVNVESHIWDFNPHTVWGSLKKEALNLLFRSMLKIKVSFDVTQKLKQKKILIQFDPISHSLWASDQCRWHLISSRHVRVRVHVRVWVCVMCLCATPCLHTGTCTWLFKEGLRLEKKISKINSRKQKNEKIVT